MPDEEFPIIEPDGEELFFPNAWRSDLPQTVGDTDCFDFAAQPNETENLVVMKLTGQQLLEMLSALYIGAEFTYPEKYLEVIRPLLAATACPPILEEQDCIEYPSYSSFIRYTPVSPYIQPNEIPDNYLTQPFLVNGENGNDIPNYEHYDVIVPMGAITLDADWFDTIAGQLPTIEIMVQGTGKVSLKMLTVPQGGVAVITLDNPPDLIDIISGVVTSAENIIDLNQDLVSLPPETALEIDYEIEIGTSGIHTIYVVFLPIIDDSLIPVRFGGGFRGAVLCDFIPEGTMGLQNLRFQSCNLEQQNADGSWTVVTGWEDWLSCVPSGGGGGVAAVDFDIHRNAFTPDQTFTNTTYDNFADGVANFNIVAKGTIALVICDNISLSGSTASVEAAVRIILNGIAGIDAHGEASNIGTVQRSIQVSNYWSGLTVGTTYPVRLQRKVNAGTGTMQAESVLNWTIIWVNDLSELFVEDIRISGGELQKKIGGVWLDVTDSFEAIWTSIQTIANNAAAAAAAAQATANNALTVANGAVTVNNAQQTTINNHESRLDSLEQVDIPQINMTLANHETRLDTIEPIVSNLNLQQAKGFAQGVWFNQDEFVLSNQGYSIVGGNGSGYVAGQGWQSNANGLRLSSNVTLPQNNATHARITLRMNEAPQGTLQWRVNGGDWASIQYNGVGVDSVGWLRVPNGVNDVFEVEIAGVGDFYLRKLEMLGRGDTNPFV